MILVGLAAGGCSLSHSDGPFAKATDQDLTWFFKLFSLRGVIDGVERMCFFAFLQKSDDAF